MKKIISLLLCGALCLTGIVGCAAPAAAPESAPAASAEAAAPSAEGTAGEAAEINMFIASPEYADAINELIAEYKKVQPNVTIFYETTQNDYPTLLKAKLNSGECPDIFSSTSGKEIGLYLDYSYNLNDQPAAEAIKPAIKTLMSANGEMHGFCIKDNYFGLTYNKALFEQAGIAEFPKTFAGLEEACAKLEAIGVKPFTSGFAEWWVYKHCFQSFLNCASDNVEELVNKFAAGEAKLADYPMIYNNFFNFIDLVVKYGDAKPLETDLSAEIAAFANGEAAIVAGQGIWIEADVLKINPEIQIGFAGYPVGDDAALSQIVSGSDQAIRVYKDSKVLPAVLDFVNWWYTSDYGKAWFADVAGVLPPLQGASAASSQMVDRGTELIAADGSGTLSIVYSTDSFHQAFGEIIQSYIAGTLDKDAACAKIEEKWHEIDG